MKLLGFDFFPSQNDASSNQIPMNRNITFFNKQNVSAEIDKIKKWYKLNRSVY